MPNFATIDVSFISLKLILPVLKTLLIPDSDIVALVKPQFEAGREQVGKKGIVRDEKVHLQVVNKIVDFSLEQGFNVVNLSFSPITGGDGNIEFLLHLRWEGEQEKGQNLLPIEPSQIVKNSHQELKTKQDVEG